MLTDSLDFLLTQREYAHLRRCSKRTIERERASGTGCRYIKIGRGVRYKQADVLDFIERHARQSISEREPQPASLTGRNEWPVAAEQVQRSFTDPTDAEASNRAARKVTDRATGMPEQQYRLKQRAQGGLDSGAQLNPGRAATNVPSRNTP